MSEFEHLHVHTQYSLLESAARVKDLCVRAKEAKSRVVAMTDHGNLHGVIDLYKKAKEAGVRPAFGCELAFALPPDVAKLVPDKVAARAHYHLVLLARNKSGFANLVELVSEAWLTGGSTPHATLEMLAAHAPGLTVLSGCLGGVAPQAVLWGAPAAGRLALSALREATEPGQLFVELQDHGLREQAVVNAVLAGLARELELPLVATNDVHYVAPTDVIAHRLLGCIAGGTTLDESDRTFHHAEQMWLKPAEAMAATGLRAYPDALRNTLEVASRIEAVDPTAKPMLPKFRDADGRVIDDEAGYFTRLCWDGLARRIAQLRARGVKLDEPVYRARLEFEVAMIVRMGFPGYFLIVQDFINWAKSNGVPVGPGRGSGAGSLAAYSLGITDLDPIALNLLFERFLNPDRVSMPDFDIDFCQFRRDRVIEYVRGKYGAHAVGQIATFQMLKSKSVVRDVGRAMGFPLRDVDGVARLIPDPVMGRAVSIAEALAQVPELASLHTNQPATRELLARAQQVENLNRHAGTHAAGVVLSDGPLWQRVPVFRGSNGELVTQYAMEAVEMAGLVKFDFLGLTTLSVIDFTRQLVDQRPDRAGLPPFDIGAIPMDDAPTFALLQSGLTAGVFQLESSGMQKLFRDLQPTCFDDISAAVALYRPGPLGAGMVGDFVSRKHGRTAVEYPHPSLEPILAPTYGVVVYQEQVMQVARTMAGYTLGAADLLRRAMGKKKPEEMAKQRATFVAGSLANGHTEEFANKIFDMLEYFSGYGFNRCVHGDTLVTHADTGEVVRVVDMVGRSDFRVHALGDDWKLHARRVTAVMSNGVKPTYRLRTARGKEIVATGNHPFRTWSGWTRLDELKHGDLIATARRTPCDAQARAVEHELVALAWLLTEGNTCHPSSLYFFNNNKAIVDDFVRVASCFPNSVARAYMRGHKYEVCVNTGKKSSYLKRPENERRSGMYHWAKSLGILGLKAPQKSVPPVVFTYRDADLELFVGRLWSGDGHITEGTHLRPYFATASKQFALDVSMLLLRLGIGSTTAHKTFRTKGGTYYGYTVHVNGEGSLDAFMARVAPHCLGLESQVALITSMIARTARDKSSNDVIPEPVREIVAREREKAGVTWNVLEARSDASMKCFTGKGTAGKTGFRRSIVERVGTALGSDELVALGTSDVYWEEVISIEPAEDVETFDLTVEEDHNFVADGIVVHNSHSAAYGLLTYQTAYLKAHYPVEFLVGTLTADLGKADKVLGTIVEARRMGVAVLPPDVDESAQAFTVVYPADGGAPRIRFGLGGMKGVGDVAVAAILEARASGPFVDLFDFCARVDPGRATQPVLETLLAAGAFDTLLRRAGVSRAQGFAALPGARARGKSAAQERRGQQERLFSLDAVLGPTEYPDAAPWDVGEMLRRERAALGFYLSAHPLDRYASDMERPVGAQTTAIPEFADGEDVMIAGVLEDVREIVTQHKAKMAFAQLEDRFGRCEVILRPKVYAAMREAGIATPGSAIYVFGRVQIDRRAAEEAGDDAPTADLPRNIAADRVLPLGDALRERARGVVLRLPDGDRARLRGIRTILEAHPGGHPVVAVTRGADGAETVVARSEVRVDGSDALLAEIEQTLGDSVASRPRDAHGGETR